jgi:murein DD-endopeptidase MepM/ murein hydrolase activator NlpD
MAAYPLPFDFDPGWYVANGNWDDPVAGHGNTPIPKETQAYAFDFEHTNSAEGRNIRAVRDGTVLLVRNDLTENTSKWTDEHVLQYLASHPGLTPQALGCGSHVLVKHQDNSVAAYLHLKPNQSFVTKKDPPQVIHQGDIVGLADNTGHAFGAHLHFEVRLYWHSYGDIGPTLPIKFEDTNHKCWRPRVGDVLASTNG